MCHWPIVYVIVLGHVEAFCKRLYCWVGALLLLHNITLSLYRSKLNRKYSNHILNRDWKLYVNWNWLASYRFSLKFGQIFLQEIVCGQNRRAVNCGLVDPFLWQRIFVLNWLKCLFAVCIQWTTSVNLYCININFSSYQRFIRVTNCLSITFYLCTKMHN